MSESMDKQIKALNALRAGIWVAALLILGAAVAFMVFAEVGQYYQVNFYLIVEFFTLLATVALAWLWLHLASSTSGWILTQTFLASLLFVLLSVAIAAASYAICHLVYTPDGRNFLQISAAFVFPALFTLLMYAFPPLQVEQTILPGGGIGQLVLRVLIGVIMFGIVVWLFMYNF